jgi:hypothetical protein
MDDAHLGHLSAAIRSGFVMDDHHVTEEQHAVCAQSNRSHALRSISTTPPPSGGWSHPPSATMS